MPKQPACLMVVIVVTCFWPVQYNGQAPPGASVDPLAAGLLSVRGEEYPRLRQEAFAHSDLLREGLNRLLASGRLDVFREAHARLLMDALDDDSSWTLMQEVLRDVRDEDPSGRLTGRSAPAVELQIREIGAPAISGGLELLLTRSARSDELIGMLRALSTTSIETSRLCTVLRSYLVPAASDKTAAELLAHALDGLRVAGPKCDDAIDDLVTLIQQSEDPDQQYRAVETIGWVGHRTEDLLTVMEVGAELDDDCLSRLLASSGNRIFDRIGREASAPELPERP